MSKIEFSKPCNGKVTSKFGYRINPITGKPEGHNGIDIAIPVGTPLLCPADGVIFSIYENDLGGKQLIIKHDNGYKTGYAHLSKNDYFKVGDKIKQGEKFALSGNTGKYTTGPHLHYTMRNEKNELINPLY